ncbi:MAG TPA: hypothetical protein PK852_02755 [Mesotoga prima]|uniref:hypothetical protein n=1 Tax=Mesotoga prima TaxID=1184387 RepID=UPI002B6C7CAC|nr:hypothetical protein [Mesotoga prima]HPE53016.1 hypothetical protein [Mesotoga prima]
MAKWKKARSAAQIAAQKKATRISAERRRGRKAARNRGKASSSKNRGIGKKGFKANFVPYARVNKHSITIGHNTGAIIPGTRKRAVTGGYFRIENTHKKGAIDRQVDRALNALAPKGTRRAKLRRYLKRNVVVTNPAIRASVNNVEARLGTSRGVGPTVIVRRGRHKVSPQGSRSALKRYDAHARKLNKKRETKPRPERRRNLNIMMG